MSKRNIWKTVLAAVEGSPKTASRSESFTPAIQNSAQHNSSKFFFSQTQRNYSSTSLSSVWTPKEQEATNLLETMFGQTMATGQPGLFAIDFDGTTAHTKKAIHDAKKATYTIITGKEASFSENTAVTMVDGVPEIVFKEHYGQKWEWAIEIFEKEMDKNYPVKASFMPGMQRFLDAVSILKDAGLVNTAIVSYMSQGRLTEAATNLDLWRYVDAVEGTKGKGQDKTTPEMFTQRVFPKIYKHGQLPNTVICIGDSRTTDRLMAESIPGNAGRFIAYGKGKCGAPLIEETTAPHIPDWSTGTDMLILAARRAIENSGVHNLRMTESVAGRVLSQFSDLEKKGSGYSL